MKGCSVYQSAEDNLADTIKPHLEQAGAAGQETEQIRKEGKAIRNLTGEYKKIEPECREGGAAAASYI